MSDRPALTNVATLRARARQHLEMGPVTPSYRPDRDVVVKLLNEALATEIVCFLRYKRHAFAATGIHAQAVKAEFNQHAAEEMGHADLLAKRIVELGGLPNFSPHGLLDRSHAEYVEGDALADMIREDFVAERIAIDSYGEVIAYLGTDDPTTRRVLEGILGVEEEHADNLRSLLNRLLRGSALRALQRPRQGLRAPGTQGAVVGFRRASRHEKHERSISRRRGRGRRPGEGADPPHPAQAAATLGAHAAAALRAPSADLPQGRSAGEGRHRGHHHAGEHPVSAASAEGPGARRRRAPGDRVRGQARLAPGLERRRASCARPRRGCRDARRRGRARRACSAGSTVRRRERAPPLTEARAPRRSTQGHAPGEAAARRGAARRGASARAREDFEPSSLRGRRLTPG